MFPPNESKGSFDERILTAAIGLFGSRGYNGVSTRDIAAVAAVNEVTVYRHYPRKRDLYIAAVTAEFGRMQLSGEGIQKIAESADFRQALFQTFRVIETSLVKQPTLSHLFLFGLLENSTDFHALFRKYFAEFVQIVTNHLEPWLEKSETSSQSARSLVLGMTAIAVCSQLIMPLFPEEAVGIASVKAFTDHFPCPS